MALRKTHPVRFPIPFRNQPRMEWWRKAVLWALNVRVKTRQETREILQQPHPVLVLGNHQSFVDGIIVALASPVPLTFAVEHAFARENPWTRRLLGWMEWRGLGAVVPLDQEHPVSLRTLLRALQRGTPVMVFPEGRISPDGVPLQEKPGAHWLARKTNARVIRIEIEGAHESRWFGKRGRHWRPVIRLLL